MNREFYNSDYKRRKGIFHPESIILFLLILMVSACSLKEETTYKSYFLSPHGNDTNSGRTIELACKTIERLNSIDLKPGDSVLFEGGSDFYGTIRLNHRDDGCSVSGIYIGSFGKGKAIINAGNGSAISGDSCSYITISNLILTGSGRNEGNTSDGIYISGSDSVLIDSVDISGFQHSGIHLHRCSNSSITQVYSHNNGFAGINISGNSMWDSVAYDNYNIYIAFCKAENNPGDPSVKDNHSGSGIVASSVKKGVIEFCEALNNGWDMPWHGNGPVGIWIWDCYNFTIQNCISHDNKTSEGAADGGGFDFDGGVSNSVLQYCLSYRNYGPGIGLFEYGAIKPWENNIVRYNISQDDGLTAHSSLSVWRGNAGGVIRNCLIYNNIFFNSLPGSASLHLVNSGPGFNFYNNIFVYYSSFLLKGDSITREHFQRNCYWNLKGNKRFMTYTSLEEWARKTGQEMMDGTFTGFYANPGFTKSGKTTITDPCLINSETFKQYCPGYGSILIDAGLNLARFDSNPGNRDFIGNPVPQGRCYDIGAIELKPQ